MSEIIKYIEVVAIGVEVIGVTVIATGTIYVFSKFAISFRKDKHLAYYQLRHNLGKVILLGLEVLVAADIIATVVTEPTMERVLTLGLIVLIRTFLSFSLEIELEGKLPWKQGKSNDKDLG
ncbi:DUF1622 domain-containing protein [Cytophagaceae bacterium ABcell3]|nr:DUF1622 domain-containing protein [Cytophagaceae bacterium ABcell3]